MKEKLNCEIVQDLLPNYIEGLTSEYTNEAMNQHLSNCEPCSKVYDILQTNEKEMGHLSQEEAKKLKGYMKKVKVANLILGVFIAGLASSGLYFAYNQLFERITTGVKSEFVVIKDLYELENGYIYMTVQSTEPYAIKSIEPRVHQGNTMPHYGTVEFKREYISRKSRDMNGNVVTKPQGTTLVFDPKTGKIGYVLEHELPNDFTEQDLIDYIQVTFDEYPTNYEEINVASFYYQGQNEKDLLLIWEEGLNLPSYETKQ